MLKNSCVVLQIVYLFDIKSNQHISTSKNQPIKV